MFERSSRVSIRMASSRRISPALILSLKRRSASAASPPRLGEADGLGPRMTLDRVGQLIGCWSWNARLAYKRVVLIA